MGRLLTIQTCGSVLVVVAFIASELATEALSAYPGSGLAWRVSLEFFRPFEAARSDGSPLAALFGPNALGVASVLLLIVLAMRVLRFRFGVALGANLGFLFASFVTHAWLMGESRLQTASLLSYALAQRPDGCLVLALLSASFLAFVISHVAFIGDVRSRSPKPALSLTRTSTRWPYALPGDRAAIECRGSLSAISGT